MANQHQVLSEADIESQEVWYAFDDAIQVVGSGIREQT